MKETNLKDNSEFIQVGVKKKMFNFLCIFFLLFIFGYIICSYWFYSTEYKKNQILYNGKEVTLSKENLIIKKKQKENGEDYYNIYYKFTINEIDYEGFYKGPYATKEYAQEILLTV